MMQRVPLEAQQRKPEGLKRRAEKEKAVEGSRKWRNGVELVL